MLHFLKEWWKFIQIHQYYIMALNNTFYSDLVDMLMSNLSDNSVCLGKCHVPPECV